MLDLSEGDHSLCSTFVFQLLSLDLSICHRWVREILRADLISRIGQISVDATWLSYCFRKFALAS